MKINRCPICGNISCMLEDKGPKLVCCNNTMEVLTGLEQDGALEKHVPVVKEENGKLVIEIGSTLHPVTEDHYISFVIVVRENSFEVIDIKEKEPVVKCDYTDYTEVYAYCNLHGLWKTKK